MKRTLFGLVFSAVLFCGLKPAQAEGITYTFDATGSGSLGGKAFANAALTITVSADTLSIVNCGGGVFSVDSISADISITGFDTATVLIPTRLFDNNSVSALGFSQASCVGGDLLDIRNDAFATYNLATAIGPIFDPNPFAAQFHDVPTTGGTLTLSSAQDVTFNAFTACGGGGPIPQASSSSSSNPRLRGIVGGISYGVAE